MDYIKEFVAEKFAEGSSKAVLFKLLVADGLSEKRAALMLAKLPLPKQIASNKYKIRALFYLNIIYAIISIVFLILGLTIGSGWVFMAGLLSFFLVSVLAYGFKNHKPIAYDLLIITSLIGLPDTSYYLTIFTIQSVAYIAAWLITFSLALYVRMYLFPDLIIFSARKKDGDYVFTD